MTLLLLSTLLFSGTTGEGFSVRCPSTCITEEALLAALGSDASGKTLSLACEAGLARVRVADGQGRSMERAFPVSPEDCRALPQTVALLARSFELSRPTLGSEPRPTVGTVQGAVSVLLEAGVAAAPVSGWMGLSVEGRWLSRFGVTLSFALNPDAARPLADGSVTARRATALLGGFLSLRPAESWGPRVALRLGVENVAARGEGFSEDFSASGWGGVAHGLVEWNQPVWRGLTARASLGVAARPSAWALVVRGASDPVRLSRFELVASAGVGWAQNF